MATITITTTAQQDTRIQAAFRSILGLDHDPTVSEIKAYIIQTAIREPVLSYERRLDMTQFVPPALDPT